MPRVFRFAPLLVAAAFGSPTALAVGGAKYGYRLWDPGDLDRDGARDLAFLAPLEERPDGDHGVVHLVSARSGETLALVSDRDWVDVVGDLDGDGIQDVCANVGDDEAPRYALRSGASFVQPDEPAELWTLEPGEEPFALADVDGDGRDDYLVVDAEPGRFWLVERSRRVGAYRVASGADGRTLLAGNGVNVPLVRLGDVDGDGVVDLASAARSSGDRRESCFTVEARSGADLSVLWQADFTTGSLRPSLAAGRDLDGDDVPDVVVGVPGSGCVCLVGCPHVSGRLLRFSGADGAALEPIPFPDERVIPAWEGADGFGWSVALVGDRTGDGRSEILATGYPDGCAFYKGCTLVLDGANGSELAYRSDREHQGFATLALGDVDGDEAPDYAVSVTAADFGTAHRGSSVWIVSGREDRILHELKEPWEQ